MTQNKTLKVAALVAAMTLPVSGFAADKILAEVNGTKITQSQVDAFPQKSVGGQQLDNASILDALIKQQLLVHDAKAKNVDQETSFKEKITTLKRSLMIEGAIQKHISDNPVDESLLKAAYDREKERLRSAELKARHILVDEEAKAKELIKQLEGGADFAKLAKEHSTGPSGKNGGDLGWFDPRTMVPEFSKALQTMNKGDVSKTPVKTQFGWHVILHEDSRQSEPPSFEQLKPQIEKAFTQQQIAEYIQNLEQTAKIIRH